MSHLYRTSTFRFDDENEQHCVSDERELCRNLSPSTRQYTIISIGKDISTAETDGYGTYMETNFDLFTHTMAVSR